MTEGIVEELMFVENLRQEVADIAPTSEDLLLSFVSKLSHKVYNNEEAAQRARALCEFLTINSIWYVLRQPDGRGFIVYGCCVNLFPTKVWNQMRVSGFKKINPTLIPNMSIFDGTSSEVVIAKWSKVISSLW